MENLLNIKNLKFYIVLYCFVFSCNQSAELKVISLTKDYQSSEPNLYTSTKGDTYLSFISSSENSELLIGLVSDSTGVIYRLASPNKLELKNLLDIFGDDKNVGSIQLQAV